MEREKTVVMANELKYTVMSIVASGVNFLTLIIFGRVFTVEDYGIVTMLQALVANIAVFMIPLQIMVCKNIADNTRNRVEILFSYVWVVNCAEVICMILTASYMAKYLHFDGIVEYMLFIGLVFSNNIYTFLVGIVQGEQDFLLLGKAGIVLYMVKLVLGVVLGYCGLGPTAVIIGFAMAEIICILMMRVKIRLVLKDRKCVLHLIDKDLIRSYLWTLVLYVIVSLYMNNGDLLLGNRYCSKDEMGLYSVAINLSKISVFLIATPIATILLPKVVAIDKERREQRKLLFIAEGITFGISVLYGIIFNGLSGVVIPLLYGKEYAGASEYVLPCLLFSTVLGMFWVFYQYVVATDGAKMFTVITALLGAIAVMMVMQLHVSIGTIPVVMAGAMVLTIVISAICGHFLA